ncbi:hypothetical protein McanMca71_003502 [Microsporum canis]|uniref:BZIP domain-containing protein n=1 Tax=Arthroderma otae (strain ATCC MYA-4605 / CBS 113480) TaxID=554155 RepID=C5FJT8_ARTOC|nr:conserved hypothetical protein [Microsporum canis CBS 113480]EEQ30949.1 conserved hypothetical protein [Microsporum canis CBS 113480]
MSYQAQNVEPQKWKVGTDKRKPTRRDPEKRRQQNIRAQRKYREKLRERMSYLEELAASTQSGNAGTTPVTATSQPETVEAQESPNILEDAISDGSISHSASTLSVSCSSPPSWAQAEWQLLLPQPDDIQGLNTLGDSTIYTSQLDDTISPESMRNSTALSSPSNNPSLALDTWGSMIDMPGASSTPSIPTSVDGSLIIYDKYDHCFQSDWAATIDCGCSSPHFQIETQGLNPFYTGNIRILRFERSAADPYANNLRLEQLCTLSAIHDLGLHVGISEAAVCADESLSPFFRPIMESTDDTDKESAITEVKQMYKVLKPDLRPNCEQITIQHHPYIDILPFPTLRKNLITHQAEVDEDEFFFDMLSGLVCWGGAGIGRKDRDSSTGYASTGTPWDVRSWEAKAWFQQKYWSLLGGEDGELVRQSEWWCSIRGD